jgi:hypothetical protein
MKLLLYHPSLHREFLSATEIGCFAYCPEAWRLEYGLGLESGNRKLRVAGTRHHGWKAVAERVAGGLILLGRILVAAVLLGLLLWLMVFR